MTRARWTLLLVAVAVAAAIVQAAAFWPGVMLPDAIEEYRQALAGAYDDWHPVILAFTWRRLLLIGDGPAPMMLLQLTFYWGGYLLLGGWALRRGRARLALVIVISGLMPIGFGLMGSALKDSLFSAVCLAAAGLAVWTTPRRRWLTLPVALLCLYAALVRVNGLFAVVPLLVAVLPDRWTRWPWRIGLAAIAVGIPIALAAPLLNRALDSKKSHVDRVLALYDLGGIDTRSAEGVLPPFGIPDQRAANRKCYSTLQWDSYDKPCPITYDSFDQAAAKDGAWALWAHAVERHPIAYAQHRLAHFNRNIRWLVPEDLRGGTFARSDPNPWHYQVTRNPVMTFVWHAATWMSETPFGWPCTWMALLAGLLSLSPRLPSGRAVAALSASGLFYGLGYLLVSISSDLRYHLWPMMAGLVALAVTVDDVRGGIAVSRRRLALTVAPAVVVTLIAAVWRIWDLAPPG